MKLFKNISAIVLLIVHTFLFISCEDETNFNGSGYVTAKSYQIDNFSDLEVDGILNVYYTQSDELTLKVRTDDNLHSIVNVEKIGNTLKIETNTTEDFKATELNVYISAPEVVAFTLNGITALYFENTIIQDQLLISKKNTGYLQVAAEVQEFSFTSDGVGDVQLSGKAMDATIDNSMIGNINAYNFKMDRLHLTHNGTGTVEINVISQLTLDITGVGDVYCKGSPKSTSMSSSGIGRLYLLE